MSVYVALLRGVNVGGHKPVAMAALRALIEDLGFRDVESVLQSGNLVFASTVRQTTARLEGMLEAEAARGLGLGTNVMVRAFDEWADVVRRNPFRDEARHDPSHLVAMVLKGAAAVVDVTTLQSAVKGPEQIRASGPHIYITYPAGIGSSKLTNAVIEKALGVRGTARNWNTVLKIEAALRATATHPPSAS